jgi:hypothetical protein
MADQVASPRSSAALNAQQQIISSCVSLYPPATTRALGNTVRAMGLGATHGPSAPGDPAARPLSWWTALASPCLPHAAGIVRDSALLNTLMLHSMQGISY